MDAVAERLDLNGQRRWNLRLWRRLARAPEAVAGRPVGWSLPWERRASQSCQARPQEAREPTSVTAKGALWPCCGALEGRSGKAATVATQAATVAIQAATVCVLAMLAFLTAVEANPNPNPKPNPQPNPTLALRLQPYASMLQPYASMLQPYAYRLQP